ncbi:MAG: hypothetical protein EBZ77_00465, partial [Chitinophagia bacterium]|nr:hypothetical protein [Chitinophagia bacterium]
MNSAFVSLGGSFVVVNGSYMPRPPINPPTEMRIVTRDSSVPTRRIYIRILRRGDAQDVHAFWNPKLQIAEVIEVVATQGGVRQTADYTSTDVIRLGTADVIVYDVGFEFPVIPLNIESIELSFPVVASTLSSTYPEPLVQLVPVCEELVMRSLATRFDAPADIAGSSFIMETNTTVDGPRCIMQFVHGALYAIPNPSGRGAVLALETSTGTKIEGTTEYESGAWHRIGLVCESDGRVTVYLDQARDVGISDYTGPVAPLGALRRLGAKVVVADPIDQVVGNVRALVVYSRAVDQSEVIGGQATTAGLAVAWTMGSENVEYASTRTLVGQLTQNAAALQGNYALSGRYIPKDPVVVGEIAHVPAGVVKAGVQVTTTVVFDQDMRQYRLSASHVFAGKKFSAPTIATAQYGTQVVLTYVALGNATITLDVAMPKKNNALLDPAVDCSRPANSVIGFVPAVTNFTGTIFGSKIGTGKPNTVRFELPSAWTTSVAPLIESLSYKTTGSKVVSVNKAAVTYVASSGDTNPQFEFVATPPVGAPFEVTVVARAVTGELFDPAIGVCPTTTLVELPTGAGSPYSGFPAPYVLAVGVSVGVTLPLLGNATIPNGATVDVTAAMGSQDPVKIFDATVGSTYVSVMYVAQAAETTRFAVTFGPGVVYAFVVNATKVFKWPNVVSTTLSPSVVSVGKKVKITTKFDALISSLALVAQAEIWTSPASKKKLTVAVREIDKKTALEYETTVDSDAAHSCEIDAAVGTSTLTHTWTGALTSGNIYTFPSSVTASLSGTVPRVGAVVRATLTLTGGDGLTLGAKVTGVSVNGAPCTVYVAGPGANDVTVSIVVPGEPFQFAVTVKAADDEERLVEGTASFTPSPAPSAVAVVATYGADYACVLNENAYVTFGFVFSAGLSFAETLAKDNFKTVTAAGATIDRASAKYTDATNTSVAFRLLCSAATTVTFVLATGERLACEVAQAQCYALPTVTAVTASPARVTVGQNCSVSCAFSSAFVGSVTATARVTGGSWLAVTSYAGPIVFSVEAAAALAGQLKATFFGTIERVYDWEVAVPMYAFPTSFTATVRNATTNAPIAVAPANVACLVGLVFSGGNGLSYGATLETIAIGNGEPQSPSAAVLAPVGTVAITATVRAPDGTETTITNGAAFTARHVPTSASLSSGALVVVGERVMVRVAFAFPATDASAKFEATQASQNFASVTSTTGATVDAQGITYDGADRKSVLVPVTASSTSGFTLAFTSVAGTKVSVAVGAASILTWPGAPSVGVVPAIPLVNTTARATVTFASLGAAFAVDGTGFTRTGSSVAFDVAVSSRAALASSVTISACGVSKTYPVVVLAADVAYALPTTMTVSGTLRTYVESTVTLGFADARGTVEAWVDSVPMTLKSPSGSEWLVTPTTRGTARTVRVVVTSPDGNGTKELTTVFGVPRTVTVTSDIGNTAYALVVGTATPVTFTFSDPVDMDDETTYTVAADRMSAQTTFTATEPTHTFELMFAGTKRTVDATAYVFPTMTAEIAGVVTVGGTVEVQMHFSAWPDGTTVTADATPHSGSKRACEVSRTNADVVAKFVADVDAMWAVDTTLTVGRYTRPYTTTVSSEAIYTAATSLAVSTTPEVLVAGTPWDAELTIGGNDAPGRVISVKLDGTNVSFEWTRGMVVTCLGLAAVRALSRTFTVEFESPDRVIDTVLTCAVGPIYDLASTVSPTSIAGAVVGRETTHDLTLSSANGFEFVLSTASQSVGIIGTGLAVTSVSLVGQNTVRVKLTASATSGTLALTVLGPGTVFTLGVVARAFPTSAQVARSTAARSVSVGQTSATWFAVAGSFDSASASVDGTECASVTTGAGYVKIEHVVAAGGAQVATLVLSLGEHTQSYTVGTGVTPYEPPTTAFASSGATIGTGVPVTVTIELGAGSYGVVGVVSETADIGGVSRTATGAQCTVVARTTAPLVLGVRTTSPDATPIETVVYAQALAVRAVPSSASVASNEAFVVGERVPVVVTFVFPDGTNSEFVAATAAGNFSSVTATNATIVEPLVYVTAKKVSTTIVVSSAASAKLTFVDAGTGASRDAVVSAVYAWPTIGTTTMTPAKVTVGNAAAFETTLDGTAPPGLKAACTVARAGSAIAQLAATAPVDGKVRYSATLGTAATYTATIVATVGSFSRTYTELTCASASSVYVPPTTATATTRGDLIIGAASAVTIQIDAGSGSTGSVYVGTAYATRTEIARVLTFEYTPTKLGTVYFWVTVAGPDGAVCPEVSCSLDVTFVAPTSAQFDSALIDGTWRAIVGTEVTIDVRLGTSIPVNAPVVLETSPSASSARLVSVRESGSVVRVGYTASGLTGETLDVTLAGTTLSLALGPVYAFPAVVSIAQPSVPVTVGDTGLLVATLTAIPTASVTATSTRGTVTIAGNTATIALVPTQDVDYTGTIQLELDGYKSAKHTWSLSASADVYSFPTSAAVYATTQTVLSVGVPGYVTIEFSGGDGVSAVSSARYVHKGQSYVMPTPTPTSTVGVLAGPITASSKDPLVVYVRLTAPNGTVGPEIGATIGATQIDDGIVAVGVAPTTGTGTSAGPSYTLVVGKASSVTFTFTSTRGEGFQSETDFTIAADVFQTVVSSVVLVDKYTVSAKVAVPVKSELKVTFRPKSGLPCAFTIPSSAVYAFPSALEASTVVPVKATVGSTATARTAFTTIPTGTTVSARVYTTDFADYTTVSATLDAGVAVYPFVVQEKQQHNATVALSIGDFSQRYTVRLYEASDIFAFPTSVVMSLVVDGAAPTSLAAGYAYTGAKLDLVGGDAEVVVTSVTATSASVASMVYDTTAREATFELTAGSAGHSVVVSATMRAPDGAIVTLATPQALEIVSVPLSVATTVGLVVGYETDVPLVFTPALLAETATHVTGSGCSVSTLLSARDAPRVTPTSTTASVQYYFTATRTSVTATLDVYKFPATAGLSVASTASFGGSVVTTGTWADVRRTQSFPVGATLAFSCANAGVEIDGVPSATKVRSSVGG